MKEKGFGKILEDGESTFGNGDGGAMCGGVISKSMMDSDPWAYMMAFYMDDDRFEEYKKIKASGNDKEATMFFEEHARSMI